MVKILLGVLVVVVLFALFSLRKHKSLCSKRDRLCACKRASARELE